MQVTQIDDHVTHAVIGGHKSIAFGVAQDAELMNVLSKALYTDQILAVVRETLCNAWDEHVKAGITDKPIYVSLTDEELTIRDFGEGIPFDMIGPIYGTYGGSTKKHDGKQTGGFGLGCKSPFAYGDHFEVTSWSVADGKMTVYQMSKSNAEIGGKAGIIPVVSVPTTERGLQVKMKIQAKDKTRFDTLIERIIRNGEMNALYNGNKVDVIPFGEMKHNFFITDKVLIETSQQILLRYGHVIYPVEVSSEFNEEYYKVTKILDAIPSQTGYRRKSEFKIVFQAPAHRISITPSREALSMQEHTIKAIKELLTDFLVVAEATLESGCYAILDKSIKDTWLNSAPKVLFETKNKIPNMPADRGIEKYITDYPQLIERYASYSYPSYKGFENTDIKHRLAAMAEAGFGDKATIESFKAEYEKSVSDHRYGYDTVHANGIRIKTGPMAWFKENIVYPVLKDIAVEDGMNEEKLFLHTALRDSSYSQLKAYKFKELTDHRSLRSYMPWLRKIVILTHTRMEYEYRASQFPVMKHWLGKLEDSFVYVVARSPKKAEQARKFWADRGYNILDLTMAQPWEEPDAAAPAVKEYVSKPKRQGIPRIRSCANVNVPAGISMRLPGDETEDLVTNPEFVMKYNGKSDDPNLPGFSNSISKFIIEKWGKLGGLVVNANQEAKYMAAGAKSYMSFLLDKILQELKTNPRIKESLPYIWQNDKTINVVEYGRPKYIREKVFLRAIYSDPDLAEYFGIVETMTEEDKLYLKMYSELQQEGANGTPEGKEIANLIKSAGTASEVIDLFNLIRKSKTLLVLDADQILSILGGSTTVLPKQRTVVRDILLQAIEG